MNRILNFVREKAFVLILLGSIVAALGSGLWAMNTVRQNLNQSDLLNDNTADDLPETELAGQGDSSIWDEAADIVTDEMNGEIAMDEPSQSDSSSAAQSEQEAAVVLEPGAPEDAAPQQETSPELSTGSAGASSSGDASEASIVSEPQGVTVTPSFVLPVSGAILQAFSGDELVYNETLGDWRTHNGTDYAASLGETVITPVLGQVVAVYTDGNWGGVVELQDESGNLWRFCGVENSTLQVGDAVGVTDVLGVIGTIGAESAAEPHLHLEILCDGVYQDPASYLQ